MKRKTAAILTGIVLTFSAVVSGCSSTDTSTAESTTEEATEDTSEEVTVETDGAEGSNSESIDVAENGEIPDGEAPTGDMPEGGAPEGEMPEGGAPDGEAPSGDMPEGGGFGGGANTQTYDYEGDISGTLVADATEVTSESEEIESTTADVNVATAMNAGTLTIKNGTLTKSGDDDNGDNCNFYGINSIILSVNEGSTLYISDSDLSADSTGSNAMFATDSGTIYAYNDTITTTSDNSRGLDATYAGTIVADSMNITTNGDHCATIATDRGGGSISATNSTLSTAGSGSPLLYSTGDIEVDNVIGTASGSQIAGMEGLNTILIYNSDLTSTITKATASDPVANAVIIYQSTSGDAETTTGDTALFQAVDSSLTSSIAEGSFFYVTNTDATIYVENTDISYDSSAADLLTIEGNDANSWGTAGSNGGDVTFTASEQVLEGDLVVDTISSVDFYLLNGSTWTGSAEIEENAVNTSATDAPITINVSSDSTWVVTESCTISALNVEDGGQVVDEKGNTVTIIANGETVVEGTSDITVTVEGSYGTSVETSDANEESTTYIDRTAFDEYYGTSTDLGTNS